MRSQEHDPSSYAIQMCREWETVFYLVQKTFLIHHHLCRGLLRDAFIGKDYAFYTKANMKKICNPKLHFCIKEIVYPKVKIYRKCTHPQTIQYVDEFVSLLEQIWRNIASNYLLINGSSTVNGCSQHESWKKITISNSHNFSPPTDDWHKWDLAQEPNLLRVLTKQANDSWHACFSSLILY